MRWILACLLMVGCAAQPKPLPTPPSPPKPVERAHFPVPPTVSAPMLDQVLRAADRVRADAYEYVARKHSQPDVIDQMTTMTRDLNTAIAVMRGHGVAGKYRPDDVAAVRNALDGLSQFLASAPAPPQAPPDPPIPAPAQDPPAPTPAEQ